MIDKKPNLLEQYATHRRNRLFKSHIKNMKKRLEEWKALWDRCEHSENPYLARQNLIIQVDYIRYAVEELRAVIEFLGPQFVTEIIDENRQQQS